MSNSRENKNNPIDSKSRQSVHPSFFGKSPSDSQPPPEQSEKEKWDKLPEDQKIPNITGII